MEWTILKLIQWLTDYFTSKGVPEPRLDAEHIIAHSLGVTRLDLYLQFERPLKADELIKIKILIERRAKREPLQYILESQPVRKVNIYVAKGVLIPRPETEILIDEALKFIPETGTFSVLDVCTGSGAIISAIANERKDADFTGTDISGDALAIAAKNVSTYGGRVLLLEGDLFEPVSGRKFDMIISNPPYCPEPVWETLQPEVRDFEPKTAMVGGKDGLDFYRRILSDAPAYLKNSGRLLMEFGDDQTTVIKKIAGESGKYSGITIKKDLCGVDRVFIAEISGA